jgi:hypothetical protein
MLVRTPSVIAVTCSFKGLRSHQNNSKLRMKAFLYCYRSKQEVLKEFIIKEIQRKNLSSKKVLEWEMTKSLRKEVEALQQIQADRSHRAKLMQNRLR